MGARSTYAPGTVLTEPADFGRGRSIAVADPTGAAVSLYEGEYDD